MACDLQPGGTMQTLRPFDRAPDPNGLTVVDAGDLLRRVCVRLRDRAARRSVDLVIFSTCTAVCVHVRSFAEALFELVGSALDAARAGSSVVVSARSTAGDDVLFQIFDAGIARAQLVVERTTQTTRR